jgi:TonB family protein
MTKDRPGLKIQVEMHEPSPEQADVALAKILLTNQDELAGLVSDYWAPCIRAAASGRDEKFRFASKLAIVPGVAGSETGTAASTATGKKPTFDCSTHVTHRRGVHPTPIYQPPPEYSEEARRAKYQGVVTLVLVVDEKGVPTNIRIVSPMGMGLDEKALECVRKWRFQPAEDEGHPIPMEIAVEVEFHLY